MTSIDPQPGAPFQPPGFQYSLRTLLMLFVVLGSSLAVYGIAGVVVFGLVVGLAIGMTKAKSLSSPLFIAWAVFCIICFLVVLLIPFVFVAREYGGRASCRNNMRNMALALRSYEDAKGHFPLAYIADKSGTPMHSWRVLMLPYLDCYYLYQTYDFTQAWDAAKNKMLSTIQLRDYLCPSEPYDQLPGGAAQTSYFAVVGPNAAFTGEQPRKLADFGKIPSHTILLIEVANSGVAWAEPRDFSIGTLNVAGATSPPMTLASHRVGHREFFFIYDDGEGVHVALADGSVRFLRTDCLSADDLRKVLAIGGCKNVPGGPHDVFDEEEWHLNWPNIAALAVWLLSVGALLTQAVRSRRQMTIAPNAPAP